MDLIQKLSLLVKEECKDETRFREIMVMQEKIAKIKREVSEINNDCQSLKKKLKDIEQKEFDLEIEVKVLERQEMVIKQIAEKNLTEVLQLENELRRIKSDYKNNIKSAITEIKALKEGYTSDMDLKMINSSPKNYTNQNIRKLWKVDGETEAMELYEKYQDEKATAMEKIKEMLKENGVKVECEDKLEEMNID